MKNFNYRIAFNKAISDYYDIEVRYNSELLEKYEMLSFKELIDRLKSLREAGMTEYHNGKTMTFPIPVTNY